MAVGEPAAGSPPKKEQFAFLEEQGSKNFSVKAPLNQLFNKLLIYVPKHLAEASMFQFRGAGSIFVKISFKLNDDKLLVEKWVKP